MVSAMMWASALRGTRNRVGSGGHMKRLLQTLMLTAVGIAGSPLFGAEPVAQPAAPAAADKDAKASSTPATKPDATKQDAAKPAANGAAPATAKAAANAAGEKAPAPTQADKAAPSPQRFTPSEQVRADFDVSFPIDI